MMSAILWIGISQRFQGDFCPHQLDPCFMGQVAWPTGYPRPAKP